MPSAKAQEKSALVSHLRHHMAHAQPSERWAMYRLIIPILDHANKGADLTTYFEFQQVSAHGTRQSVDVALLDMASEPVLLVEAKRAGRRIAAAQIEKYRDETTPSIVTNGVLWILLDGDRESFVNIFPEALDVDALDEVIEFIRGGTLRHQGEVPQEGVRAEVAVHKVAPSTRARRISAPKTRATSARELRSFSEGLDANPPIQRALLDAITEMISAKPLPPEAFIEVSRTRVVFFDSRLRSSRKRTARILLRKREPEVIVRAEIVDAYSNLFADVPHFVHDKGPHMRSFRLRDEGQARKFGHRLAEALQLSRLAL